MNFEAFRQFNSPLMAIITLTTDLGTTDYYVAAVKGAILSQLRETQIVDITNEIPKFDLLKTAFVLARAWKHFPKGTIHLVGVESLETEDASLVALSAGGHFFIGADNGLLSIVLDVPVDEIVQLTIKKEYIISTFPLLDVFVPAACHIARGGTLEVIGKKKSGLRQMIMQSPPIATDHIKANIIYIDSFGNLITNLSRKMFEENCQGKPFEITLHNKRYSIRKLSRSYTDAGETTLIALFGHSGFLEIALVRGSAARLLGLKVSESIRVVFYADSTS